MRDATAFSQSRQSRSDYSTRILECPELGHPGIRYLEDGEPALLPWGSVKLAIAAEIGEPEGVRTIVFDLIAEIGNGRWLAYRLDAEPGSDAMQCARELAERLEPEACGPSIKSLATDGIPTRWYPDLPSFEEDASELISGI